MLMRIAKSPKCIFAVLAVIAALMWLYAAYPKSGRLVVTFLDVGQGDSAVIRTPSGKVVVVDGGGEADYASSGHFKPGDKIVIPFLRRQGINKVDLVIASHAHADHVSGLIDIVKQMPVKGAITPVVYESTPEYIRLLSELRKRKVRRYPAMAGTVIQLDPSTSLEVLYPENKETVGLDANDLSIVMLLEYKKVRFLFTGDCTESSELEICKAYPDLQAQILKVGHHGSASSNCSTWLERVRPSLAVISVGRDNRFSLPSPEVIERLQQSGCRILRTDRDGAVTVTTDGRTINASTSRNR